MQWHIEYDGTDALITGPGRLEIVLRDYTPGAIEHPEPLPEGIMGRLLQRTVTYPLEEHSFLQLVSTCDPGDPGAEELHILHVGETVSWQLPEAFAETLHAFFMSTAVGH